MPNAGVQTVSLNSVCSKVQCKDVRVPATKRELSAGVQGTCSSLASPAASPRTRSVHRSKV